MYRTKLKTGIAIIGFVAAFSVPAAAHAEPTPADQSAEAAQDQQAAAPLCGITKGPAFWEWDQNRNVLTGDSYFTWCSTYVKAEARIQRSRWYGWEDMVKRSRSRSGDLYMTYNCSGTGKHDFRYQVTTTQLISGKYKVTTKYRYINGKNCG